MVRHASHAQVKYTRCHALPVASSHICNVYNDCANVRFSCALSIFWGYVYIPQINLNIHMCVRYKCNCMSYTQQPLGTENMKWWLVPNTELGINTSDTLSYPYLKIDVWNKSASCGTRSYKTTALPSPPKPLGSHFYSSWSTSCFICVAFWMLQHHVVALLLEKL